MSLISTFPPDTSQPIPSSPPSHPSNTMSPSQIRSPSPRTRGAKPKSPQPAHSRAMQKVLSQGSVGSGSASASGSGSTGTAFGSAALATPTTGSLPMSPASGSGGVLTPKARKARLSEDAGLGTAVGSGVGGKKDEQLAQDLGDLQVQSPHTHNGELLSTPTIDQPGDIPIQQPVPQYPAQNGHGRQYSDSTDSSESDNQFFVPSQLGSMYGADGFGIAPSTGPSPYGYSIPKTDSPEYSLNPDAAAVIAAADEAIKQLNGTTTVYRGPTSTPGPQVQQADAQPPVNPYELPRGYANFVKPQNRSADHMGVSRQSSTSSSTTEASTSSEESDLCIPRIEWVDRDVGLGGGGAVAGGAGGASAQTWGSNFFTPYQPQRIGNSGGQRKSDSPARMPPPSTTHRLASPRTRQAGSAAAGSSQQFPPALPVGASAHTPSGLKQSSALPRDTLGDALDEDDDDQTVGHRERSRSLSSQSAQSGLDLLLRAVTHSSSGKERGDEPLPEVSHDGKGKRKAVATQAVDQWRNSGIPSGVKAPRYRRDSTTSTEPEDVGIGARIPLGQPPAKKRRRSSAVDDVIDPELLREDFRRHSAGAGPTGTGTGETGQVYGDADIDEDMPDDEESEPDDGASEGGSEYGGDGRARRVAGGRSGRGGGMGGSGKKAGRGRPSVSGQGGSGGKGGTPVPIGAGAGGGAVPGRKGRKTDSPSGLAKGGKAALATTVPVPSGGVQCDYTNPLPPYNRCQDVFTRKYDLPRHMARHARREGELVYEGKLAENKAILWATIKDRPKVTCQQCGESFTRMDALKRHQAKQHH